MVIGAHVDTTTSGVNEPFSGTEKSGTSRVGTYNIRSGRSGGMESALQAMDACKVNLGIFQEIQFTDSYYTCDLSGYSVLATKTTRAWSGGISLFYRREPAKLW